MKQLILAIFLFQSILIYAQKDFLPGYIIKKNGDTLNGYLFNDQPKNNFKYCTFKAHPDSGTVTYKPDEISGYRFKDGKYFVSYNLPGDSLTKSLVFLQLIIKGKLNIYSYMKGKGQVQYFVENQQHQMYELKDSQKEKKQEEYFKYDKLHTTTVTYSIKKREYIGVLKSQMPDGREIFSMIDNSQLNDKSLTRVVKAYTEKVCKDTNCIVFENTKKAKSEITFSVGQSWTKTDLSELTLFEHNAYREKNSINIGIGYTMSDMEYINERITIQTGIYFSRYELFSGNRTRPELSFNAIRFPLLFGYKIPLNYFEPYFNIGLNATLKTHNISNNEFINQLSDFSLGPNIGLGLKYKISEHINIQLYGSFIYEYHSLFSWQEHFANIYTVQARVGYMF